jgi:hypothetical protein
MSFIRKPIPINTLRAILDAAESAVVGEMAAIDLATGNFKRAVAGVPTLLAIGTFTETFVGDGSRSTMVSLFRELNALAWLNDPTTPVVMPAMRGSSVFMRDGRTVTADPSGNAVAGTAVGIDLGGRVIVVPSSFGRAGAPSTQQGPPYDPTVGAPTFLFPNMNANIANATTFINWDFSRIGDLVYLSGEVIFDVTGPIAIDTNMFRFAFPPNLPPLLPIRTAFGSVTAYESGAGYAVIIELTAFSPVQGVVVARTVPAVATGYKAFFTMVLALESLS